MKIPIFRLPVLHLCICTGLLSGCISSIAFAQPEATPPADDYPVFKAKNEGTIRSAELYWLLNRLCYQGDEFGVEMLLRAGADPNGVNDYRNFLKEYPGVEPSWPINTAAWQGHLEVVKILLEAGAKVDLPESEGFTALIHATQHNHPEIVAVLLKAGADRSYRSPNGTALDIARKNRSSQIVSLLEEKQ